MPVFRSPVLALSLVLACATAPAQTPLGELSDPQLEERIRKQVELSLEQRKPALAELRRRKSAAARKLMAVLFESETDVDVRYKLLNAVSKLQHAEIHALLIRTLRDSEMPEKLRRLCGWGLLRQGKTGKAALVVEFTRGDPVVIRLTRDLVGRLDEDPDATRALDGELAKALEAMPVAENAEAKKAARTHVYELVHARRGHPADARYKRLLVEMSAHDVLSLAAEATRQLATLGHKSARAAAKRLLARTAIRKAGNAKARAALAVALSRDSHRGSLQAFLDLARIAGTAKDLETELKDESKDVRATLFGRLDEDVLGKSGSSAEATARRRAAVAVLAMFKTESSTKGLLRAVEDRDVAVAIAAVQGLLDRENASIRGELLSRFASTKGLVRAELLRAVHRWRKGDRKWQRVLAEEIAPNRHLGCRLVALGLLADSGRVDVLEDAHQLLDDEAWQLRSAAIAFCRDVPHKSSVPLLIARARVETGRLADEVQAALESLTERRFAKAEYWQKWWDAAGGAFELEAGRPERRTPPVEDGAITYHGLSVVSDRVCFVVDISGSMKKPAGTDGALTRLELAQQSLLAVARKLDPSVKLNLITFSGRVLSWNETLRAADVEAIASLEGYVGAMEAAGATNVHDALEKAFSDPEVDTVYLLSDGDPSAGEIIDKNQLARAVATWNRSRRVVVHTIAIGLKSKMMRRIAEQSGGTYVERR